MAVVCLLICILTSVVASTASQFTPVAYPARIFSPSQCGQGQPLQDEQLMESLALAVNRLPFYSCEDVVHRNSSATSGYYMIQAANGSSVKVYCDMEGTNCGGEGGWMRVAYLNMTEPGATCPQGLVQKELSGLTLCGRNSEVYGCNSAVFPTLNIQYSRVCGKIRGYQFGTPDAFNGSATRTIDEAYVNGVSITYAGSSRKHIWTYAAGLSLSYFRIAYLCPCNSNNPTQTPPFVGNDYYCETGANINLSGCCNSNFYSLHEDDVLWDGEQCVGVEATCCTNPNMPWFIKTLTETTTDNIEVRVCGDQGVHNKGHDEDTPLQVIELYIK